MAVDRDPASAPAQCRAFAFDHDEAAELAQAHPGSSDLRGGEKQEHRVGFPAVMPSVA